jgi:hypothetical protein
MLRGVPLLDDAFCTMAIVAVALAAQGVDPAVARNRTRLLNNTPTVPLPSDPETVPLTEKADELDQVTVIVSAMAPDEVNSFFSVPLPVPLVAVTSATNLFALPASAPVSRMIAERVYG